MGCHTVFELESPRHLPALGWPPRHKFTGIQLQTAMWALVLSKPAACPNPKSRQSLGLLSSVLDQTIWPPPPFSRCHCVQQQAYHHLFNSLQRTNRSHSAANYFFNVGFFFFSIETTSVLVLWAGPSAIIHMTWDPGHSKHNHSIITLLL